MKILYLCSDAGIPVLGRKGASVHVREMIAAFSRAGHEVVLATPLLNKSPWETPEEVTANLIHVRPSAGAQAAVTALREFSERLGSENALAGEVRRILYNQELEKELTRRFAGDPPDFIYERAALYGTAGISLAKTFKVPLLLEINAPLAVEHAAYRGNGLSDLPAYAERWTLSQANAVLTVSRQLQEHVVSLGVPPERVHVFPNGVNPHLFKPGAADEALRARLGLKSGPVLGFLGGLRPWHGVEILPELMVRLSKTYPDLHLLIAGDGQLRPQLEREMKLNGLSDRVVFTGTLAHEEVPGVLRLFDVGLAPYSKLDHPFYFSPLKVFEYMACGIAVVASNSGQLSELISDGQHGLLYPAGEIEALSAACDRLLKQPKLRLILGNAAAEFIRQQYTWDLNANRAIELARSLLQRDQSKS